MNWFERYVAEVRSYLPGSTRDDISDELQSLLEDKLEARAEDSQRPLNDEDMLLVLKETGHPLQVAAGYHAGQSLISSQLFPLYVKVVRNLILAAAAVYLLSIIWTRLMPGQLAWSGFSFDDLWNFSVNWLVFITLGFYLAERYLLTRQFFENWEPRSLPPTSTQRQALLTSISTCIAIAVWLVLLNMLSSDYSWAAISGQAENPVDIFVFWLKVQALIVLAVYLLLLFRPYWSMAKRLVIMLADLAVMFGASLTLMSDLDRLPEFYPAFPPEAVPVNEVILYLWLAGVVVDILVQGYRLMQMRSPH